MIKTPIQPRIGEIFNRLIENNRLASSYLFYGPPGSGKWQAAVEIAAEILYRKDGDYDESAAIRVRKLVHPDLMIVFPMPAPKKEEEKREFITFFTEWKRENPYLPVDFGRVINILKENVRDFQQHLYKSPVEGKYRVGIFEKAETMPRNSFDILLKTIEEPPPNSLLMLLTDNFDRMPETIRSRCQKIRFKRVNPDFIRNYLIQDRGLDEIRADLVTSLASGSISRAEQLMESGFFEERDTAIMLLGYLLSHPLQSFWTEFLGLVNLRDKARLENLLAIWQTLYHDIAVLLGEGDEAHIINKDQMKALHKLAGRVREFEYARMGLNNLLAMQKLGYRNINPLPAMFETAQRLKSHQPPLEIRD
jgi:DNA polymerase-3 subunit delta'